MDASPSSYRRPARDLRREEVSPRLARRGARWRWSAVCCGLLLLLGARGARGEDEVGYKRATFQEVGPSLAVTVGFREMIDRKLRRRLRDGFATTVVMRIYLYPREGDQPVAFGARTLRAIYDLWDEQFILRLEEPHRVRSLKLRDEKRLVDVLTSFWRFPVAELARLEPGVQYVAAVIAEVNPMSEELLEEVRRWLRNPHGVHRRSGGENLFGSFVSIFVNNKIRGAEKTFRFRTQPFFRRP